MRHFAIASSRIPSGARQAKSAFRSFQEWLMIWSATTHPPDFVPPGIAKSEGNKTSKFQPFTWLVIGNKIQGRENSLYLRGDTTNAACRPAISRPALRIEINPDDIARVRAIRLFTRRTLRRLPKSPYIHHARARGSYQREARPGCKQELYESPCMFPTTVSAASMRLCGPRRRVRSWRSRAPGR